MDKKLKWYENNEMSHSFLLGQLLRDFYRNEILTYKLPVHDNID